MKRIHFKMRTMLWVLTGAMVWYGLFANRVINQQHAISEIRRLGGAVGYAHESSDDKPNAMLAWLASRLGPDWFFSVERVEFNGGATDDSLALLRWLPDVKQLVLRSCLVSHVGLRNVAALSQLEGLALHDATAINDEAIQTIAGLKHLKQLALGRTAITDASLATIAKFPKIQAITLSDTAVTDAGVKALENNQTVDCLELSGTEISDRSASIIGSMPHLRMLGLNETQLTDDGLSALHGLREMRHLSLRGTQVSPDAVAEYKQTHPMASVLYLKAP
jgi:hypothetical protein